MKPDPLVEIEVGVRGDTAASLGQAGRRLRRAVRALADADHRGVAAGARPGLVQAAAHALWCYVVQREAIGITDHRCLSTVYGVTGELWRHMGAMPVPRR